MTPLHINLSPRELMLLAGIIGSSKSDELMYLYEEIYSHLSEVELEIVDEFIMRYINYNVDESEILDDAIEAWKSN